MRPEKGQNRGCYGSTESGIVALRRSWLRNFLRKKGISTKQQKTSEERKNCFHIRGKLETETMTKNGDETMLNRSPP
ncbi:MAG: hypothetical protein DMG76_06300 [Acidobacteria bacterium]|nr:MAG: hypothetical protein DMG76_06300 [Acidobacteriota bacterium]